MADLSVLELLAFSVTTFVAAILADRLGDDLTGQNAKMFSTGVMVGLTVIGAVLFIVALTRVG